MVFESGWKLTGKKWMNEKIDDNLLCSKLSHPTDLKVRGRCSVDTTKDIHGLSQTVAYLGTKRNQLWGLYPLPNAKRRRVNEIE